MPRAAVCEEYPETLLGFIEKGSHIGLSADQHGMPRHITLLTESEFQLEKDVRELEQPALLAKHPALAAKAETALKSFVAKLKESDLPPGTQYGEPQVNVTPGAGPLHRVVHVGSDYLVLESLTSEPEKFVVSADAIRQIRWYRGPGVNTRVSYVREDQSKKTVAPQPRE